MVSKHSTVLPARPGHKPTKPYVALLRGINVGTERRVDMRKLKAVFESLGYGNVSTYINSGNVIFYSDEKAAAIRPNIESAFKKAFKFSVPMLIKSAREISAIADAIPRKWQNDDVQRTDVAYLFEEVDSENTIGEMPVKREFMDVRYVKGAILWNLLRTNLYRSQLNKLIGHRLYQFMTMRNVNTARYLAERFRSA